LIGKDGLRQFAVVSLDDVRQTVDVRVLVEFHRRTAGWRPADRRCSQLLILSSVRDLQFELEKRLQRPSVDKDDLATTYLGLLW